MTTKYSVFMQIDQSYDDGRRGHSRKIIGLSDMPQITGNESIILAQ
jgi:hypothetical protein